MLVTILTVAYNAEDTIARTIESVLNQTYSNIEYVIIDGASQDKTVAVAQKYQKLFDDTVGRSLKIISEPDKGMYDALNKGAQMAHGEIVGQINADDWYEPDAVETMVELYNKEKYDAAWGSIRIIKKSGNMIKHAKIGKIWATSGWCHPGMFSRRKILLEFPYVLETMYDDFDYITAVHQAGKKVVTIDKVVSNFTFGNGGQSTKKSLKEVKKRVLEMLEKVGVLPASERYEQYPFEMSGGMMQRVMIAMAMSCNPKLLLADEPTTALDVTIQAQILDLMKELQQKNKTSIVIVTHNLGVVAEICDRVSVMYAGKVVETAEVRDIFDNPKHPYTKALMKSRPKEGDKKMVSIKGAPPGLSSKFTGCAYADRCDFATELCRSKIPKVIDTGNGHTVACHLLNK